MLLLSSTALLSMGYSGGTASAQTPAPAEAPQAQPAPSTLPTITVETSKKKSAQKQAVRPPPARPAQNVIPQPTAAQQIANQVTTFNSARSNVFTTVGANQGAISKDDIQKLPQGANTPIDKVLLQLPGVSQDSAASGNLHVRNEHGNVAYRINGIMLPDGVGGFGSILETGLIGNLTLLTGALPAEFGLRTAAVVDIKTRDGAFDGGGNVGVYGGSHDTFTTSAEYGGTIGGDCKSPMPGKFVKAPPPGSCRPVTEYFFTGRYFTSNLGIENPTPEPEAIHDLTKQERGFGYISTIIDPTTRISSSQARRWKILIQQSGPDFVLASAFGTNSIHRARRESAGTHLLQRGVAAEIGQRRGSPAVLFQSLQQPAFRA